MTPSEKLGDRRRAVARTEKCIISCGHLNPTARNNPPYPLFACGHIKWTARENTSPFLSFFIFTPLSHFPRLYHFFHLFLFSSPLRGTWPAQRRRRQASDQERAGGDATASDEVAIRRAWRRVAQGMAAAAAVPCPDLAAVPSPIRIRADLVAVVSGATVAVAGGLDGGSWERRA